MTIGAEGSPGPAGATRGGAPADSAGSPGAPTPAPAVRADGLIKRFGDLTAVDGVTFDFERGRIFGLLGPNG
jgi:hypothetical protein